VAKNATSFLPGHEKVGGMELGYRYSFSRERWYQAFKEHNIDLIGEVVSGIMALPTEKRLPLLITALSYCCVKLTAPTQPMEKDTQTQEDVSALTAEEAKKLMSTLPGTPNAMDKGTVKKS
jgi:hypothetical protein